MLELLEIVLKNLKLNQLVLLVAAEYTNTGKTRTARSTSNSSHQVPPQSCDDVLGTEHATILRNAT